MKRRKRKEQNIQHILKKLPPNYTVGSIFLNGLLVPVTNFSNVDGKVGYFINDGQVTIVDSQKIDGLSFAPAEEVEEEEEE